MHVLISFSPLSSLSERSIREDEKRANEFSNRMASQASKGEAYAASAGKKMKEDMIREEQRTLREIEKKYRLDDEREREKREKRKNDLVQAMAINKQLGENRRIEQQQEKDRERQLKLKYENDNRVEDERQRKMAHEKHMRIKEMREALDDQVNLRMQSKRNESALTALEISLNKGLIDRVQGDPELYNKVLTKAMGRRSVNTATTNNIF